MAFHSVTSSWLRALPSTSTDDIKLLSMIERAAAKRIHELQSASPRADEAAAEPRRPPPPPHAAASTPACADDDEDDPQHPEEIAHFTRVIESFLQYGDITKRHVANTERRERALGPSALAMLPPSAVDRKAKLMHAAAEGNAVRARARGARCVSLSPVAEHTCLLTLDPNPTLLRSAFSRT